jgi:ABC-type phosphate/phosphonate transport system substrate-binding protein
LAKRYAGRIRLVATPRYQVPGCEGATYRSAILVREADLAETLEDLRGRRCVINDWTSNSGMNLLRASIAPLAGPAQFFETVEESGSHRQSVETVSHGQADVTAVDCVTWAHLRRLDPASAASLRVLQWTAATPSLPFITSATVSDAAVHRLRSALGALTADPGMNAVRERLFLEGFDLQPTEGFGEVLRLEQLASAGGYPELR